jgi:MFS transporter, ACS family, tartrate transporter
MGWIKDSTGGFSAGLLCLAGAGLVGAGAALVLHHNPALELPDMSALNGPHEDGEVVRL